MSQASTSGPSIVNDYVRQSDVACAECGAPSEDLTMERALQPSNPEKNGLLFTCDCSIHTRAIWYEGDRTRLVGLVAE